MKDFLLTFKFLLKQSFSFGYVLNKMKQNKRYRNTFLIVAIALLLCLPSYIIMMVGLKNVFTTFQQLNFQSFFIVLALMLSLGLIILFGFFQIMGYLYFSNDVKLLTPLPIKPRYYLLSKFFVVYVWELFISLFVILPFFVVYGIYENLSIINWITMIINFFFIPVVPLVIVGILTVLLMRVTNIFAHKDAVRFAGFIILILGLLGIQYYLMQLLSGIPTDPAQQQQYVEQLFGNSQVFFIDKFSKFYPIAYLVKYGMVGSAFQALLSVIGFIGVSIVFIYLFGFILKTIFLDTYLKNQNNNVIRKRKGESLNTVSYRNTSVVKHFAKIDFITMLKEPIFALNCLLIGIILPVIFIVYAFVAPNELIKTLIDYYQQNQAFFWLMVAVGLGAISAFHPIAPTTFSREGESNWIMRTLPISAKDHIKGRTLIPLIINIEVNVIIIGSIVYMFGREDLFTNILYGIFALFVSLMATTAISYIGIYIDLKRPMLKWETPQQAVKQNLNVLVFMLIGIIYGSIMVGLYFLFNTIFGSIIGNKEFYFLLGIVLAIINGFFLYITYDTLKKRYEKNLVYME